MRRLLALALLACSCRSAPPSWLDLPPTSMQQGLEVTVDGVLRGTTWIKGLTGEAMNVSGADFSRCSISFEAFDVHGAFLGTARAEREGLAAGGVWEFEARFARDLENASTISAPRVLAVH